MFTGFFRVCDCGSDSVIHPRSLSCLTFAPIIFTELSVTPLPISTLLLPGVAVPLTCYHSRWWMYRDQIAHPPTHHDVQSMIHHSSGRRQGARVRSVQFSAEGVPVTFLKKLVFLCGLLFILYHKANQIHKFREMKNPTIGTWKSLFTPFMWGYYHFFSFPVPFSFLLLHTRKVSRVEITAN